MGLISRLVGAKEIKSTRSLKAAVPSGGIAYDAGLVDKLKDDHKDLIRIFSAMQAAVREVRFGDIPHLLSQFKHDLQLHLAAENVRFYVYVQQHVAQGTETAEFIARVRREMNDIARDVMKFIDANMAEPPTNATVVKFGAELEQIGAVLVRRVEKEESQLYSLYQP